MTEILSSCYTSSCFSLSIRSDSSSSESIFSFLFNYSLMFCLLAASFYILSKLAMRSLECPSTGMSTSSFGMYIVFGAGGLFFSKTTIGGCFSSRSISGDFYVVVTFGCCSTYYKLSTMKTSGLYSTRGKSSTYSTPTVRGTYSIMCRFFDYCIGLMPVYRFNSYEMPEFLLKVKLDVTPAIFTGSTFFTLIFSSSIWFTPSSFFLVKNSLFMKLMFSIPTGFGGVDG